MSRHHGAGMGEGVVVQQVLSNLADLIQALRWRNLLHAFPSMAWPL
jgi:hypothetical protein